MFFFFNDTATTEIYTLSLHDALPISFSGQLPRHGRPQTSSLRHPLLFARTRFRTRDLHALEKSPRPQIHARHFRTHLRNLQNLSHHTRQIPSSFVGFYRHRHRAVLRLAASHSWQAHPQRRSYYFGFQPAGYGGQLQRGVGWHPRGNPPQHPPPPRPPSPEAVSPKPKKERRRVG